MKDFKQVLMILLAVAFVGGVGAWLFTFSSLLGWLFFGVSVTLALDYTFSVTGLTTKLVDLFA